MFLVSASPVRSSRPVVIFIVALLAAVLTLGFGTRTAVAAGPGGACSPNAPTCEVLTHDAFVDFQGLASDGCTLIDGTVQALQIITMPGHQTATYVFIQFFESDNCTGTFIGGGSNQDPSTGLTVFNGSAQFSTPVGTGTITGTAPMFDFFGNPSTWTSTIDMTWQGDGQTTMFNDIFHAQQPGVFITLSHTHWWSQNAVTTGVLTDEAGNNLASVPNLDAQIRNSTGGDLVIVKS